jgi:hypothetical protein
MHATGSRSNSGRLEVLGNGNVLGGNAELEFGGYAVNAASTGLTTGRNATLRFGRVPDVANGLVNAGAVALTGGTNDVFGDVENMDTGKVVVSSGASAAFYDDVVQNGTLQVLKAGSTNSIATFAGSFTGSGGSSGGGDIFFLGDLRPGNSE